MIMKTICAWCKEHMKGNKEAKIISHGICKKCLVEQYPEFADDIIKDLKKETI